MTKNKSVFDQMVKIDWQKIWSAIGTNRLHMVECDDAEGYMNVGASVDGDMHLSIDKGRNHCIRPSFRSRTWGGGGKNERVRIALALLALAVVEDVLEKKSAACPNCNGRGGVDMSEDCIVCEVCGGSGRITKP